MNLPACFLVQAETLKSLNMEHIALGEVKMVCLTAESHHFGLDQGSVNFVGKGPESKYFWLCEPYNPLPVCSFAVVQ